MVEALGENVFALSAMARGEVEVLTLENAAEVLCPLAMEARFRRRCVSAQDAQGRERRQILERRGSAAAGVRYAVEREEGLG